MKFVDKQQVCDIAFSPEMDRRYTMQPANPCDRFKSVPPIHAGTATDLTYSTHAGTCIPSCCKVGCINTPGQGPSKGVVAARHHLERRQQRMVTATKTEVVLQTGCTYADT